MPSFTLDTGICSYLMKRSHPLVLKRLQAVPALAALLPYVEALDLTDEAAIHYAQIRADLKKRGAMIGANDLFIAAHARGLGITLVTNNSEEFRRVPGLAIENWTTPPRRKR